MEKLITLNNDAEFMRFVWAGALAASANFGSRFLFSLFFSFGIAVFFAYLVGMTVGFFLMRDYVFKSSKGPLRRQVKSFIAVNVLGVLQTMIISVLMAQWLLPSLRIVNSAETLGHFVGVLVPVVTSYFGHKFLTFR